MFDAGFTIAIIFEIAMIVFIVWGFFHEDMFIRFERRVFRKIFKRNKVKRTSKVKNNESKIAEPALR